MGNHKGEFSLRVGNYRIVYELDASANAELEIMKKGIISNFIIRITFLFDLTFFFIHIHIILFPSLFSVVLCTIISRFRGVKCRKQCCPHTSEVS